MATGCLLTVRLQRLSHSRNSQTAYFMKENAKKSNVLNIITVIFAFFFLHVLHLCVWDSGSIVNRRKVSLSLQIHECNFTFH